MAFSNSHVLDVAHPHKQFNNSNPTVTYAIRSRHCCQLLPCGAAALQATIDWDSKATMVSPCNVKVRTLIQPVSSTWLFFFTHR
uniref:Uncharacterized protein n=1 Tax=Rhizophora mucronata TaxID=61149 RepID=A0A2P2L3N6_RHIMU